ncbi:MAG: efflux RND transporter periplasmic adaptor subunit [Draconibacterium sp.]|nr:efflux RND transporter periplasmic adaptor subunit [Draconibacterium sp.]
MLSLNLGKKNQPPLERIEISGDTIKIPDNSTLLKKIKTTKIAEELYSSNVSTFGIAQAIPTNYAEIAAPFSGRITKSFVKLGQYVKKDEPVFAISSPSIYEVGKMYYQAKQEMALAEKNLKRQQDLYKNGVGIQKDLEEAEVNYELNKRDYENVIASLKVYNVDPDELVLGQPLIVRSPISGNIVDNNIVIGQYLKEDADPVVIVAELSKVWIVGQVKEKDINLIHKSEEIEITAAAISDKCFKGKIYYISDLLDEETRSVQVFIECENSDHSLKPGMYVSIRFIEEMSNNILIPSSSVFQKETGRFVFVAIGENRFVKRDISVRGATENRLLVKSGISIGEHVVTEGGYFLLGQN